MGSALLRIRRRLRRFALRLLVWVLRLFSPTLNTIARRICRSPGIPTPNSTSSYWMVPPSPISQHNSRHGVKVPEYADVVIIGSGITGTSFARTILDWERDHGGKNDPLQVVMLEARDTCSGATGRNGGHITPNLYNEYTDLKKKHGIETAKKIMRFRLSHFPQFLAVAKEEGLLEESQCREVVGFDVYHNTGLFQAAKSRLATYRKDLPVESTHYRVHEGAECIRELQLSDKTAGCLSTQAGAVHPYRLVTGILCRLLKSYPSSFHLYTQTPCTTITSPDPGAPVQLYNVTTPKGIIQTPHVIHATNGWISHLLPGMRGKIIPARVLMTTQRPWKGLGEIFATSSSLISDATKPDSWAGKRAFVFYPDATLYAFDYLTQQPMASETSESRKSKDVSYPPPAGELMLGTRFVSDMTFLGNSDDGSLYPQASEHLSHALASYFGNHEGIEEDGDRVKALWSGILAVSVDEQPWVGRIPDKVSGRCTPLALMNDDPKGSSGSSANNVLGEVPFKSSPRLSAPGEWMAAGYTGEGMVHAWLSGKALAYMVLGLDHSDEQGEGNIEKWFPDVYRVTDERWENVGMEDLIGDFLAS